MAYSTYYSIDILALKLVSLIQSISTSQLHHGFTVHWIVPPSCCMYFLGLCPWNYMQPSRSTNPIHCKNHDATKLRVYTLYVYIHVHVYYIQYQSKKVSVYTTYSVPMSTPEHTEAYAKVSGSGHVRYQQDDRQRSAWAWLIIRSACSPSNSCCIAVQHRKPAAGTLPL